MTPLLTVRQVAELVGFQPGTILDWHERGEGPPAFRIGGRLRFREDEIEAWLEERREASQRATAKVLGVGQKTVSRDLAPESDDSQAPSESESLLAVETASESDDSRASAPAPFQTAVKQAAKRRVANDRGEA